ncbi:MAG: C10 family peptidase, partial [Bacteroidales bacterium]|nr:C10 family peptidase [Bacteroidales bacterium]
WIDELRISNSYRKYRDDVLANVDTNAFPDSVFIPLKDGWTVYQWPLAEYYPYNPDKGDIERANACGPTMLTRGIHYWEYPRFPKGVIEHDWVGLDWYANYDETEYLWDQMPPVFSSDATEEVWGPAATLSAQVGVASRKTYDNMYCMPKFLKENFLFSKKTRIVFEEEYTKEEWENIIRNELSNGRICMVGGWGHYYIINGYNSKNQFFTDYSFNDLYWNDIKDFDYGAMQDMVIYFEPDWGDKELELEQPKSGGLCQKGSDLEIQWSAKNISNLIIEYSSDAGYNWHTLADNVDANLASYSYALPDSISDDYRIRISDKDNLNVYRKSSGINVYDHKDFAFEYPKANTNLKKGTNQPIYWKSSGINTHRLEYTVSNSTWITWRDSVNTKDGFILATLPNIETNQIKLRAVDLDEPENTYESENFHLITDQLWGGPYEKDDNTLLLMHFENEIRNEANNELLPNELNPIGIYEDNYNKNMGRSFRVYNPDQFTADAIHIKNSENLDLGNNWTIETWVKVESIMGIRTVASLLINKWEAFDINAGWQYFGAYINYKNGSHIEFGAPKQYKLHEWYHVAMISSAEDQKVYFMVHDKDYNEFYSDVRDFPEGSNGEIAENENLLTIGGLGGGSNLELDGYLDELRITKNVTDYQSMIVGINELAENNSQIKLSCYPNPVTSESVISFQTKTSGDVDLSIFDIRGRKIYTLLNENRKAGIYTVPVSNALPASGVYFCKLSTEEEVITVKLIQNK